MSGHIAVSFGAIEGAAGEVRATAGRIAHQLEDLKAGVKRIAGSWEGSAQEGYQARQAEWDRTAADLNQTLGKIAQALQNAAENYRATEGKNASIWG